jgi:hypothetical protein
MLPSGILCSRLPLLGFTVSILPVTQRNFADPAGLFGAIVQAQPGYRHEIDAMISMAGEAMVANISQCVESIGEVRHNCVKIFGTKEVC